MNLGTLPTYTKLQLARHQLDRAIRLLLDERDPICAITLAGAAEEILGKLIQLQGGTHSLQDFIDECVTIGRERFKEEWKTKDFAEMENFYRNELKHYVAGSDITVTKECAIGIIDRAIENYWRLTGARSDDINKYLACSWRQ